ncbi:hypothetical protein OIU76_016025, partial [Salix suchowensis]
MRFLLWKLLVP